MASSPGSLGTSLTDSSCGVIGSHASGYPLSLFLAKTLNAEIRRSNSTMHCCRDMDQLQKSFGGDYRGVGRIYIKVVDKFQSYQGKSVRGPTPISKTKPASLKASRRCSTIERPI